MELYVEAPHSCPYLPEESCQNLTFEAPPLPESITSKLIATGFRHFGLRWFIPSCEKCDRCKGIKIDVNEFSPSKSQRRLLRKNCDFRIVRSEACVTEEKIELINRYHEDQQEKIGWFEQYYSEGDYYEAFIRGNIWCEEYQIFDEEKLIGVGMIDRAGDRASSIYFYYDPKYRSRSLGTWSILQEIEICRDEERKWLHLGLWNESCASLAYKNRFSPHEFLPQLTRNELVEKLQEIFSGE